MHRTKKVGFFFGLFFFLYGLGKALPIHGYTFGLKSSDNTIENILTIEKEYRLYLPLVGFIYDPRDAQDVIAEVKRSAKELGTQRIYHLSLSPNNFTAEEVANGAFDKEYLSFFSLIKELNLKVIFRTMHEMNGGRYPRSSHPENFKKARIHVWKLSRKAGLDTTNLLFDFSVNHRDMPTKDPIPSQKSPLQTCKLSDTLEDEIKELKKKPTLTAGEKSQLEKKRKELTMLKECPRFEDYYPGDNYVDIVGVTFYNRGKATSNRLRISPEKILNHPDRNTLERLKKFGKPLFVDEVGTTAVYYPEAYEKERSRSAFLEDKEQKNHWLHQLSELLEKDHFLGALYFNVDYTDGLNYPILGEADRAIINPNTQAFYEGFWELYQASKVDFHTLLEAFELQQIEIDKNSYLVNKETVKLISQIDAMVSSRFPNLEKKHSIYALLKENNDFPRVWRKTFEELYHISRQQLIEKQEKDPSQEQAILTGKKE